MADRPATEPRTEAGRRMLHRRSYWSGNNAIREAILAIEAEAAQGAAPLPPCPICEKPDLFIGTDGKPGCPHCEVAVRLPSEVAAPIDSDAKEHGQNMQAAIEKGVLRHRESDLAYIGSEGAAPRAEGLWDEAQAWADEAARRSDPELGTPAAEQGEWPGESRPIDKARERQILGLSDTPAEALPERPSIEDEWYEQDSGGGDDSAKGAEGLPSVEDLANLLAAVGMKPRPHPRLRWTCTGCSTCW